MKPAFGISAELKKFTVVLVLGLVLDIAMGFVLYNFTALSLAISAMVGFLCGALFNYAIHEKWTFLHAGSSLSLYRASLYLLTTLVALIVRMSTAYLLTPFAEGKLLSLLVLITSAGMSFIVNYLLSRFVVYRKSVVKS